MKFKIQSSVLPVESGMQFLFEPSEFFNLVREKIKNSHKLIIISALYIGSGDMETTLIEDIHDALTNHASLRVRILVDHSRSQRGPVNSIQLLQPLIQKFGSRIRLFLYQTPNLRDFPMRLLPSPLNEILGVYHCKYLVFDTDVILTGANISDEYFRNRQDRYMSVLGQRPLVEFLDRFTDVISGHSMEALPHGSRLQCPRRMPTQLNGDLHSLFNTKAVFDLDSVIDSLLGQDNAHGDNHDQNHDHNHACTSTADATTTDAAAVSLEQHIRTVFIPLVQHAAADMHREADVLSSALQSPLGWDEVAVCTPYPSFPTAISTAIANSLSPPPLAHNSTLKPPSMTILAPGKESHGFANGRGIRSLIPLLHEASLEDTLTRCLPQQPQRQMDRHRPTAESGVTSLLRYSRENWTFHAKGLWLNRHRHRHRRRYVLNQNKVSDNDSDSDSDHREVDVEVAVTYLGSSNFSDRSWLRDFELGFLVVTTCPQLICRLQEEKQRIFSHHATAQHLQPPGVFIPPWIRSFSRMARMMKIL